MPSMVQRLHEGLPHHAGGAEDAIEARVGSHLEDGRHAAAFLAEEAPQASVNSTSEDALERLPSLSFNR